MLSCLGFGPSRRGRAVRLSRCGDYPRPEGFRFLPCLPLLALLAGAPLQAAEQWFLMGRHGECAPIASLKRKIPDLGGVTGPQAFAELMRANGYAATITRQPLPRGAAFEVVVPAKELALVFVSAELCAASGTR
jgi:hypothetical protein